MRDDLQSWRPCAPDRLGGTRPSKNFALLVCCLLRPVGQQCACAALSLALAYALLAQNAFWPASSDQFGGQLGVGDACCRFLFVSGGCGQSFGRVDPGKPPFGRMLAGFALAALVASALAGGAGGGQGRPWHSTVVAGPCVQELRATMRAALQHGVVFGSLLNWEPEKLQSNTSGVTAFLKRVKIKCDCETVTCRVSNLHLFVYSPKCKRTQFPGQQPQGGLFHRLPIQCT